jgi:hypothetical protein
VTIITVASLWHCKNPVNVLLLLLFL